MSLRRLGNLLASIQGTTPLQSAIYPNSCLNISSEDFLYSDFEMGEHNDDVIATRVVPIIFLFIFVTGIFGNALVLYVFVKNTAFRTVTNMFLLNLAIVDLVYLCFCCPFTTVKVLLVYWPFGNEMCKMVAYLMVVCMSVNVMTLTAIGFDRYFVIVHPKQVKPYRTKQHTVYIIVILWVVSFLAFIPIITVNKEVDAFEKLCMEVMKHEERKAYSTCMFIFFYAIPQFLVGFCYIQIARKLRSHLRGGARLNQTALVTLRIRGRIVKMTFVVTVAFAVCWLPLHVAAIMNSLNLHFSSFFYYLQLFAPCFAYVTVSVNPVIYCFMSKTFRKSLKAAFTCRNVSMETSFIGEDVDLLRHNPDQSSYSKQFELRSLNPSQEKPSLVHNGSMPEETRNGSPSNFHDVFIDKECQTDKIGVSITSKV